MYFVLYSFDISNYRQCVVNNSVASDLYTHLYSCVITGSQGGSGTQQHYCLIYTLWLNIGNDIRFPNECVNMNRLDTY